MNIHRLLASILLSTMLWIGGYQSALAQLDCGVNPDAIQDAIDAAVSGGENFVDIEFVGTCNSFSVRRISANVSGDGTTSVVVGGIGLQGSTDNTFADFDVEGVSVCPPLEDCFVDGGIGVARGSYLIVRRINIINGSLSVLHNSGADLFDSTVEGPLGDQAVIALFNSLVRLQFGNTITSASPGTPAVAAARNSTLLGQGGNTVSGNFLALNVANGSYANIRGGDWIGGVGAEIRSTIVARPGASFDGNVTLSRGSTLVNEQDEDIVVSGNLVCEDRESSLSGNFDARTIRGCSPY